jgi:hypothetical protein
MQILKVLLLAIVTLGMQMPGGVTFELCACQGLSRILHDHARVDTPQACCHEAPAAARSEERSDEHAWKRTSERECRGCFELHTPRRPVSDAPSHAKPLAYAPPPVQISQFAPRLQCASWSAPTERAHDPPWTRVNLPLRI